MRKEYLQSLLIDLGRLMADHIYPSYEQDEPGYGEAMLRAYLFALTHKENTGLLSHEIIKETQRLAMSWGEEKASARYKISHNNLTAYPFRVAQASRVANNPSYALSEEGINEFISHWYINTDSQPLLISLAHIQNPTFGFLITSYSKLTQRFQCNQSDERGLVTVSITREELALTVKKLLNTHLFYAHISPLHNESEKNIEKRTTEEMAVIIESFNTEIKKCHAREDKIRTILKHIQKIDQLHPFSDGNIRTCYILMNKLFIDHGLGFSLVMNPNRFDVCSLDELCDMVEDGFLNFEKINQQSKIETIELSNNREPHDLLKTVTLPPHVITEIPDELQQEMLALLLLKTPQHASQLLASSLQSLGLFNKPNSIKMALEEKNPGLAFRRACFGGNVTVISAIISDFSTQIDFSQKTSKNQSCVDLLNLNKKITPSEKVQMLETLKSLLSSSELRAEELEPVSVKHTHCS